MLAALLSFKASFLASDRSAGRQVSGHCPMTLLLELTITPTRSCTISKLDIDISCARLSVHYLRLALSVSTLAGAFGLSQAMTSPALAWTFPSGCSPTTKRSPSALTLPTATWTYAHRRLGSLRHTSVMWMAQKSGPSCSRPQCCAVGPVALQ